MIHELRRKILMGGKITREEAQWVVNMEDRRMLFTIAKELTDRMSGRVFEMCSIVNARSGRCSENCKWCAQSAVSKAEVDVYDLVDLKKCIDWAKVCRSKGVRYFSFVTSGRALPDELIDRICEYTKAVRAESHLQFCVSMGLLKKEQFEKLRRVGILKYHCNLETSRRMFEKLCSTHTLDEKLETIRTAREVGMEICSGGIIGMGETMDDRIDLALMLQELEVRSIPINILNPIPGTPLEGMPPLSDEEVLRTIIMFRFTNPKALLRFAGGRSRIAHIQEEAMKVGINAGIVGDLLTTVGSTIDDDVKMALRLGFSL